MLSRGTVYAASGVTFTDGTVGLFNCCFRFWFSARSFWISFPCYLTSAPNDSTSSSNFEIRRLDSYLARFGKTSALNQFLASKTGATARRNRRCRSFAKFCIFLCKQNKCNPLSCLLDFCHLEYVNHGFSRQKTNPNYECVLAVKISLLPPSHWYVSFTSGMLSLKRGNARLRFIFTVMTSSPSSAKQCTVGEVVDLVQQNIE